MLEAALNGLALVLQPITLLYLMIGVIIGFFVGILPGLGGAATLAIMLPFAFGMDPVQGFAFLLGMWIVSTTTGDITSVLFGIPGEPTSAAAVMDGYPLTRKGQAGRALGAVLTSSALGSIIGAVFLGLTITVIRPVVLALGSPEFFAITFLGLTFVITLSGKNLLKGFIMAALGLLVAMIGIEASIGAQRYTFGQLYLWEGIGLIPLVVGLFGGAEVIQLMLSKKSISTQPIMGKIAGISQGIKDSFRHWFLVVRTSAIGIVVGLMPGLGGSVSQWLAYGHAQQSSKNPEEFGKGAIEGVVAAGATNNAKDTGSLIPTIAFGIPGSAGTAVLLGGFLVLGLNPGVEMLTTNLDVTFSMVTIAIISNLVAVMIAFVFIRPLIQITRIPGQLLVPGLILLLVVGAYSATNNFGDVIVMLVATAIGVVCIRWDWPRVPFLLAIILGGLAEDYLLLSNNIFGLDWLTRPGVILLGLISLASVGWAIRTKYRKNDPRKDSRVRLAPTNEAGGKGGKS